MPKTKPKTQISAPSYEALKAELDHLMLELQREDLEVDVALQHYQRGLELVRQLEIYLQSAENTIRTLQNKFSSPEH